MNESVPAELKEDIVGVIFEMKTDLDNGFQDFREAINYSIFHMFVHGSKNSTQKESVSAALTLKILSDRLRTLENLLT